MASGQIRVGFIGLNAKDCWAVNAHLPYLKETSKYKIVALLNSSEDSARASIKSHGLADETRAYGSPEALAADEDVDLIVCSVRVDRHYPILKIILESTKATAVHCEWPLGKNLAEAEELDALARNRNIKTIIGLQGRQAPVAHKVRQLTESDKIGSVLSTTITSSGYNLGAEDIESLAYLSDIDFGGNLVSIHFSHHLDTITQAIGQLASYSCILETKRSVTLLRDKPHTYKPTKSDDQPVKIVGSVTRTTPDQILLQGHLTSGALISYHMRGGQNFPGAPGLIWSIYGEKGELRVTTPATNLHFGGPGHELWYHDQRSDKAEQIPLPEDEFDRRELPSTARGPARIYEAFADGREDGYGTWKDAIKRHKLVDELFQRSKNHDAELPAAYEE